MAKADNDKSTFGMNITSVADGTKPYWTNTTSLRGEMIPPESRLTWTDIPTNQTWSIRAFLATSITLAVGSIIGPLVGGSILRIIAQFSRHNRQCRRVITMVFLVGYVTSAYTHLDASQITNSYVKRLGYFRVVLLAVYAIAWSLLVTCHLYIAYQLQSDKMAVAWLAALSIGIIFMSLNDWLYINNTFSFVALMAL